MHTAQASSKYSSKAKCELNNKAYFQKSHLNFALRTVHQGDKDFKCKSCSYENEGRRRNGFLGLSLNDRIDYSIPSDLIG